MSEIVGYFDHLIRGWHHHAELLRSPNCLVRVKQHIFLVLLIREEIKT